MSVRRRTYIVGLLIALVILLALGSGFYVLKHRKSASKCDFPEAITTESTGLILYCPDEAKLPSGITVDVSKASSSSNAVIYPIHDGANTLSVSLQPKPPANQLTNFVTNIIPLHFDVNTNVGKGYIGVTPQGQSLLDLPTHSSTWIFVTGPKDYDSARLKRIAQSFQSAN